MNPLVNGGQLRMPIYKFKCPECDHEEEVLQGFDDDTPQCPKCRIPMERGTGNLAFWRFKGDIMGETPGSKKYGAEITRKMRK